MRLSMWVGSAAGSLLLAGTLAAQAPAGATGQCKDGSYSTAEHKAGACSGHKGVQSWFADAAPSSKPAPPTQAVPAAPANAPAPRSASTPSAPISGTPVSRSAPPSSAPAPATSGRTQAAGGGPGMVWVNTSSKVYHCFGSREYGATKAGKYESEASAKAEGARPAYGKACSQ